MKTNKTPLLEDAIQTVRSDIESGLCDSSTLAHFGDIVRAVNSHDALLHAALFARNVIDHACGQLTGDEAKRIYNMMVKAIETVEL